MCFKKQFTHVILCAQEKCLINYDTFLGIFDEQKSLNSSYLNYMCISIN